MRLRTAFFCRKIMQGLVIQRFGDHDMKFPRNSCFVNKIVNKNRKNNRNSGLQNCRIAINNTDMNP